METGTDTRALAHPDGSPRARHPEDTFAYRLVRMMIRLLLWLFFRRSDVVGREQIPSHGGVIIAANHHNALVDAMLIMAAVPRPVVALAKAPLFRHPLVGPFLKLVRAVPVNRRLEGGDDPQRNDAMFAAAIEALCAGNVILIFPEGRSQPQPILLPLRTGAARLVVGAARSPRGPCPATLLPVGIVYHDPGTFRSASVQLTIGTPVATADLVAGHGGDRPDEAVRAITARLTEAIAARIVEAEDHHTLGLLSVLERAWWEEAARRSEPPPPAGATAEAALAWKRRVMRAARYLAERDPGRVAEMRRRVERYRSHLDEIGITSEQLGRPYTARLVSSYVVTNVLWLALGLPLAAWGIVCHAAPYWMTGHIVPWLRPTLEEEATHKMAVGLVIYPPFWIVEGWLVWRLAGLAALLAFVLMLVPSGILALLWRERLGRFVRQAQAFFRFLGDRNLHRRLLAERRALVEELRALADRVPPDVLKEDAR